MRQTISLQLKREGELFRALLSGTGGEAQTFEFPNEEEAQAAMRRALKGAMLLQDQGKIAKITATMERG